uniref:Uncharacterized protein LOC111120097 n=1 Tax=Crassostrea virginica TaxID=6565 RepID=A0A8B8CKV6_CRAVI|nr:uncharacterized protein LOC111120097 [Crassostrea virginica]
MQSEETLSLLEIQQLENIEADIDELGIEYILQLPDDQKIYPLIAKKLKIPQEILKWGLDNRKKFVRSMKIGNIPVYNGRTMVIGCALAGKTTLVKKMKGDRNLKTESTSGIEIHSHIFKLNSDESTIEACENIDQQKGCLCLSPSILEKSEENTTETPFCGNEEVEPDITKSSRTPKVDNAFSSPNTTEVTLSSDIDDFIYVTDTEANESDQPINNSTSAMDVSPQKFHAKLEQKYDFNDCTASVNTNNLKMLSLLDFAGHSAYYACHHIFFSPRAVFILVVDMTKELSSVAIEACKEQNLIYSDWTYADYIRYWLGSIHTYSSKEAPVILAISHAEAIGADSKKKDTVQTKESTQAKEIQLGTPNTDAQTKKQNKPTEESGIEADITNVNRSERQELKKSHFSYSGAGSDGDRTRFFRLSLIIIDELTQILRDLLHNEVPPTQILKKVIKVKHLTKTLRKDQIAIITNANTRGYQDFDITLLYTLLRNVCQNITPPSQNWGVFNMPSPNEVTVGDDIERIRLIRNSLFGHMTEAAISKTEFKKHWSIISGICTRIQTLLNKDYVKRLQDAEERSIDPDTEEKYLQLIKRQAEEERAIRDLLQSALAQGNANRDMLQNLQISIPQNIQNIWTAATQTCEGSSLLESEDYAVTQNGEDRLRLENEHCGSAFGPVVSYKQPLQKTEPPRGTPEWIDWKCCEDPRTPSYWTKYTSWKTLKEWNLSVRTTSYSLEKVDKRVYNSIKAALKSTLGGAKIISIQRVENVHLYQKYAAKCQKLCRETKLEGSFTPLDILKGSKGPVKSMKQLDPSITQHTCPEFNEYYFFHGAHANAVQSICSQGLDWLQMVVAYMDRKLPLSQRVIRVLITEDNIQCF